VNVEYLPKFLKDLKALKSSAVFGAIDSLTFRSIARSRFANGFATLK
jgi:hypothetical protein